MSQIVMLKCRIDRCGQIAKALIISESDYVERQQVNKWPEQGPGLAVFPVCVEHAPEAAHEAASSMNADEFLIVELPAFGVGGLT